MKIDFVPTSSDAELVVPPPQPAAKYIPDWYKKIKKFDGQSFDTALNNEDFGVKSCVPFLDSMINGYIQETWCDMYVSYNAVTGVLECKYSTFPEIVGMRNKVSAEIDSNFYPFELVWQTAWVPQMPKGYSVLITHPMNHTELPFFVLSGIMDSDSFTNYSPGNIPFYIKNNFTGIIPAGTPMYQIIPIKRENWSSNFQKFDSKKQRKNVFNLNKNFYQLYKNNFHKKKVFK